MIGFSNRKIVVRYLSNIVLKFFLVFLFILFLIIFGNQIFLVINQSLKQGLFASEMFPLILMKALRDTPFLISLSFSLSIIYALNKLYKSSEMFILINAGLSEMKLVKILSPLIFLLFLVVLILTTSIVPSINYKIDLIKQEAKLRPDYIFFQEGVFQNFSETNITFFSPNIIFSDGESSQTLQNIFLHDQDNNKIILAESGTKDIDRIEGRVFLNLFDGNIYENLDLESNKSPLITNFKKFKLKIFDQKNLKSEHTSPQSESKTILNILYSKENKDNQELLYRISIPLSLMLMSVISVFISRTNPRSKRNYSLGFGLLMYIGYYNMIIYFKQAETFATVDNLLNFIALHGLFICFILFLMFARTNLIKKI